MTGQILNIQRFCTHDGPGIRTTVFLKGCPLRCLWCHNPESQHREKEVLYNPERCVGCLHCVPLCEQNCHTVAENKHVYDRSACLSCGKCMSPLCSALELAGEPMDVEAILTEVLKDKPFYDNSGGGLTLSGGEPLYQAEFCLELLQKAKECGLHVCLETCGLTTPENLKKLAPFVDIFLFDYKETDPMRHKAYTGVDNEQILQNLRLLNALGKQIVLRCPIIPTLNDRPDHFRGIGALAEALEQVSEVVVEPYHAYGASKYERLDRAYDLPEIQAPDSDTVAQWIEEIQKYTGKPVKKA
ncbi:MAG: glycyl-radical enzyme activating protein [Clostridia bacterium]|nr:glycyl-radical enzyme activating protein [Clostridia bacterium]